MEQFLKEHTEIKRQEQELADAEEARFEAKLKAESLQTEQVIQDVKTELQLEHEAKLAALQKEEDLVIWRTRRLQLSAARLEMFQKEKEQELLQARAVVNEVLEEEDGWKQQDSVGIEVLEQEVDQADKILVEDISDASSDVFHDAEEDDDVVGGAVADAGDVSGSPSSTSTTTTTPTATASVVPLPETIMAKPEVFYDVEDVPNAEYGGGHEGSTRVVSRENLAAEVIVATPEPQYSIEGDKLVMPLVSVAISSTGNNLDVVEDKVENVVAVNEIMTTTSTSPSSSVSESLHWKFDASLFEVPLELSALYRQTIVGNVSNQPTSSVARAEHSLGQYPKDYSKSNKLPLEVITSSLATVAARAFEEVVLRKNRLIHSSVLKVFLFDLGLTQQLKIMKNYYLLGDGNFVKVLKECLFEGSDTRLFKDGGQIQLNTRSHWPASASEWSSALRKVKDVAIYESNIWNEMLDKDLHDGGWCRESGNGWIDAMELSERLNFGHSIEDEIGEDPAGKFCNGRMMMTIRDELYIIPLPYSLSVSLRRECTRFPQIRLFATEMCANNSDTKSHSQVPAYIYISTQAGACGGMC